MGKTKEKASRSREKNRVCLAPVRREWRLAQSASVCGRGRCGLLRWRHWSAAPAACHALPCKERKPGLSAGVCGKPAKAKANPGFHCAGGACGRQCSGHGHGAVLQGRALPGACTGPGGLAALVCRPLCRGRLPGVLLLTQPLRLGTLVCRTGGPLNRWTGQWLAHHRIGRQTAAGCARKVGFKAKTASSPGAACASSSFFNSKNENFCADALRSVQGQRTLVQTSARPCSATTARQGRRPTRPCAQ